MIPKKYRFLPRSEPHFFEKATKLFFEFGVLFYVKNVILKDNSFLLVAGIVPKKKWTKATHRNHHKRILREALIQVCESYDFSNKQAEQLKIVVYLNKNPNSLHRLTQALSKNFAKIQ